MQGTHDNLLREQIEYYRARAHEYDEWFLRQGRYDRGEELNRQWWVEVNEIVTALREFRPQGKVLELACGTGLWTQRLVEYADTLTAIDASPEMLEINASRIGNNKVRYINTDIFNWEPEEHYDTVFFSFWLSHVPPERFSDFWALVRRCTGENGRAFLIDSLYTQSSTAKDHTLEGKEATSMTRRLNDGREYKIVKVFYSPDSLAEKLQNIGWSANLTATANFFIYGSASPSI